MKFPKVFLPEKNLDKKTKSFLKDLVSPNSFNEWIQDKIGNYKKEKEYYPDKSLPEYKHMVSAVECASIFYGYRSHEIIRVTVFRLISLQKNA